jgi:hypothetical protein
MRLPSDTQVNRLLDLLAQRDFEIGSIKVSPDGITVFGKGENVTQPSPAPATEETPYEKWKKTERERNQG